MPPASVLATCSALADIVSPAKLQRARRFVVVPSGMPPASVLAKLLRKELANQGPDGGTPRVMAFVKDAEAAQAIANPLRNALWEEHRIGLVLPEGQEPTKTLQVCPLATPPVSGNFIE